MASYQLRKLLCGVTIASLALMGSSTTYAGGSWFSKTRTVTEGKQVRSNNAESTRVFDVVVSLYNSPDGDGDPDNNLDDEEQVPYENIVRHWADSVCEQSNGVHKMGRVRMFTDKKQRALADVIWNKREWPRANVSGYGVANRAILFGDIFPNGCGNNCNFNFLSDANQDVAGYTLGHEWGHYVYGLFDEYVGSNANEARASFPQTGDVGTDPSIMNSQWNANGGNYEWLNHSTSDNIGNLAKTAQGRVYGKSGWEILSQKVSDDPKSGQRTVQPNRKQYTELAAQAPDADDSWVKEELDSNTNTCRSELDIVWMTGDIELQIVLDKSGSMGGSPITNAKAASKILVDLLKSGQSAAGLVTFNSSANQQVAITALPDPDAGQKNTLKTSIDSIGAGGLTAMYDGAALALTNLTAYRQANNTDKASQVTFLLSDGGDNRSSATLQSVSDSYAAADVPLITFGYGSGAPGGVLRSLADATGGRFFSSPTTLAEIQQAFIEANTLVSESRSIANASSTVDPGDTLSSPLLLDDGLGEVNIIVNFVGAVADTDFSLRKPNNDAAAEVFTCEVVGSSTLCTATIGADSVEDAGPGEWKIDIENKTGSSIDYKVNVVAQPSDTNEKGSFDLRLASIDGAEVEYPNPIRLTAAVSREALVTGINVNAQVTDPDGEVSNVVLLDDGQNGDAIAGDGIYTVLQPFNKQGSFSFVVTVDNNDNEAEFTDASFQPSHPTAPMEGDAVLEPEFDDITENFVRVATIEVQTIYDANAVNIDDGDSFASATGLDADNADYLASILNANDVDMFELDLGTTPKDEFLVVRLTDIQPGLNNPVLTILDYRGNERLSVDLGDFAGASYPNIRIDERLIEAFGGDPDRKFYASVKSADGSTGGYSISLGNPVLTDEGEFLVKLTGKEIAEIYAVFEEEFDGKTVKVKESGGSIGFGSLILAIVMLVLGRRRFRS